MKILFVCEIFLLPNIFSAQVQVSKKDLFLFHFFSPDFFPQPESVESFPYGVNKAINEKKQDKKIEKERKEKTATVTKSGGGKI